MKRTQFILLANEPLLDFVNTLTKHADHDTDYLADEGLAVLFFKTVFKKQIKINKKSFQMIKIYRRKLSLFFNNSIQNQNSKKPFNSLLPSISRTNLQFSIEIKKNLSKNNKFNINFNSNFKQEPLQIIAQNLLNFLLKADPVRIKKCKSKTCSHFFYDKTKANKRAWCSMKSCGNLAKVRKFRNKK